MAYDARQRRPEDLTARARIRDTAMRLFADKGFDGTSIRAIAAEAGVSIGLVQHHYGSKAGLRDACDDIAIGTLLEEARAASDDVVPLAAAAGSGVEGVVLRYLARALIDGSPTAAKLFDSGAEMAEDWLAKTWPDRFADGAGGADRAREAATVMAAMHLGPIALHAHLSRRLGIEVLDQGNAEQIPTAMFEVYAAMAAIIDDNGAPGERARHGDGDE